MTFNSTKLQNGLTILTYSMESVQSVAINLIVKVGSRYENPAEEGISHFLEHMAFKGTKTRSSKMIAEEFDSIGGYFNAYTSREQTVYYAKVLGSHFNKACEILADILQNSLFAEEEIKKEYQVILQEIAQTNDNPDDLVTEKFYNLAYPSQAIGRSILGNSKILSTFSSDSFFKYVGKHYHADNIYLSIAGNIRHQEAVDLASNLFTSLSFGQGQIFAPAIYEGGFNSLEKKDLEQSTILLGFESVPYFKLKEFYHAQILSLIFGGGISSRLFQHIRENLGLAYSVGSYNSAYCDSGLFCIYASTNHDKVAILIDGLINEIQNISKQVTEQELARAKEQIKAGIYMAEEKSSYKSEEVGKNFAIFGKYSPLDEIMQHVMDTSIKDVETVANNIFSSKPTLSIVGAKQSDSLYQDLSKKLVR